MSTKYAASNSLWASIASALCGGLVAGMHVCAAGGPNIPPPPPPRPSVRIVDEMRYESPQSARNAWRAQTKLSQHGVRIAKASTAPVEPMVIGGKPVLKMTCNFKGTTIPRACWDRRLSLDLTLAAAITFDVYAENLQAIGYAHIYIKSGDGWYGCTWYPKAEGKWNHVRLRKSHFYVDRAAAGWAEVNTIRFSPWAARREDAALYVANLGIEQAQAPVLILRQNYGDPAMHRDQKSATRFTQIVADLLEKAGVALPVVDTSDLTRQVLGRTKLVLTPYGSRMDARVVKLLADFIDAGGKVVACFSVPAALRERLGVSVKGWRSPKFAGEFSSMRFIEGLLPRVPRVVGQRSWGIIQVAPVAGVSRVAAWWHSADGQRTDAPAVLLSAKGAYVSHVILNDDAANKRAFLKGLLAYFCPEVLEQACETHLANLGAVVGANGWEEAVRLVSALPAFNARAAAALADAKRHYADAQAKRADGNFDGAFSAAEAADASLLDAYCLAQRSQWPEFRATWCHPVVGIAGWSWDRTAEMLQRAGIHHLILNALHGASAGYASKVLPTDASLPRDKDYFGDCVRACKKYGIKLHVWITNYQPHGHAPKAFIAKLKAEGRLQIDVNGKPAPQLCPSDDRNVALQRDAMVEAACMPGVAGIHFDYIRYPNNNTCYCSTCRAKFEKRVGRRIEHWPQDVLRDGPLHDEWLQFRRDNITRLVREVHEAVRRAAPMCMISAAVFKNYPQCRDSVGQDWKLWIEKGYLDFVCPMDYTGSDAQFANSVRNQLNVVGGKVPCYPGIGLLKHSSPADAIRQIQITRRLKTGGFVLWSVFPQYIETYRCLGKGITAQR